MAPADDNGAGVGLLEPSEAAKSVSKLPLSTSASKLALTNGPANEQLRRKLNMAKSAESLQKFSAQGKLKDKNHPKGQRSQSYGEDSDLVAKSEALVRAQLEEELANQGVLGRVRNSFTGMFAGPSMQRLSLRKMKMHRKQVVAIDDEDDDRGQSQDHQLAAGEQAFLRNRRAVMASNVSPVQHAAFGVKKMSPIARNPDRVAEEQKIQEDQAAQRKAAALLAPVTNLAGWFDAGLHVVKDTGILEGKRSLPSSYDRAAWATANVPLIKSRETGVVVWPVRFDLVPLFTAMEGSGEGTLYSGPRAATTLFYYASKAAFDRIVASPDRDPSEVLPPEELAEEIWDRLEADIQRRELPALKGVPEYSLQFLAREPDEFASRTEIASALYRTSKPQNVLTRTGHCVAILVPTDHCMGLSGRDYPDTVVVIPPGEDAVSDEDTFRGKARSGLLTAWKNRMNVRQENEVTPAMQVESMNLLEGLVDTNTNADKDKSIVAGKIGQKMNQDMDDLEEMARRKLSELEAKQQRLEAKMKHLQKVQAKREAGAAIGFLICDPAREDKLKRQLRLVRAKAQRAKLEISEILSTVVVHDENLKILVDIQDSTELGEDGDDGERNEHLAMMGTSVLGFNFNAGDAAAVARKRRFQKKNQTEFAPDVQESVQEVGDEYHELAGDVFKEVFGGHLEGVKAWLNAKGDPNIYHDGTGWAPLHMATSMGDPGIVEVLLQNYADPSKRSTENGWTALHFAVLKNCSKMLQIFLSYNDQSIRGKRRGAEDSHQLLVNVKALDDSGPLIFAVERAPKRVRDEMVRLMLEASGDANATRKDGWSPLSLAVQHNLRVSVKLLVQHRGMVLDAFPFTDPPITIWQAAARHPGLQGHIQTKLNSRDIHIIERKWPGSLSRRVAADRDKDDDE